MYYRSYSLPSNGLSLYHQNGRGILSVEHGAWKCHILSRTPMQLPPRECYPLWLDSHAWTHTCWCTNGEHGWEPCHLWRENMHGGVTPCDVLCMSLMQTSTAGRTRTNICGCQYLSKLGFHWGFMGIQLTICITHSFQFQLKFLTFNNRFFFSCIVNVWICKPSAIMPQSDSPHLIICSAR